MPCGRMIGLWGALFLTCSLATSLFSAEIEATLTPAGGAHRMFNRPWPTPAQPKVEPITLRLTVRSTDGQAHQVRISLNAEDIFGKSAGWNAALTVGVPADGTPVQQELPFAAGMGFFRISGACRAEHATVPCATEVGIVPPFHPGVRPDSFFTSTTSELKSGEDLLFLQALGVKVELAPFQPEVSLADAAWLNAKPTGAPLPLDFTRQDQLWAETKAHDTWLLPLVGCAFQGPGGLAVSDLARKIGMRGPPRDNIEFVNTWGQILKHYPEITTYVFGDAPGIFDGTWAATAEDYRKLQTLWCDLALRINPRYPLLAGGSAAFIRDHIEPFRDCWQGKIRGTAGRPRGPSAECPNWRAGDQFRSIDAGMLAVRRMQLPFHCLTAGGSDYRAPETPTVTADRKRLAQIEEQLKTLATAGQTDKSDGQGQALAAEADTLRVRLALLPDPRNNSRNAAKLVQYCVQTALDGAFSCDVQWEAGYAPDWTRCNTALGVMTSLLEDRPIVADVWPENELIWGAIFANPKQATPEVRALPRGGEFAVRWGVPVPADRENDTTKVAVVWSLTGRANDRLDEDGTLTIADADGLRAYDFLGREISTSWGRLVLPFSQYPVYIVTDTLSVLDLRARLAKARIDRVTAVNVYALSLLRPAADRQYLIVRVENQLNREVSGELAASIPGKFFPATAVFRIPAGKLAEVSIPWPGAKPTPDNRYAITLEARLDGLRNVTRTQLVSSACFVRKTIVVDGSLADWADISPVLLDSRACEPGFEPARYLQDPQLARSTGTPGQKRIVARLYAAYDAGYVYLAAAVNEDSLHCAAGGQVEEGDGADKVLLPFRNGMPDGLNHVCTQGDVLQFSFGFRERMPGWGRQMNDPYAWKGDFCDADYSYVAHVSSEGDQLVRLWGPKTPRLDAYQGEAVPGVGPVGGSSIKIVRDEANKLTVYEMAIPRGELMLFNPLATDRCRFGFVLCNGEGLGELGLNWSEAAGVFDYWRGGGSFPPSWAPRLPCQTYFGILR